MLAAVPSSEERLRDDGRVLMDCWYMFIATFMACCWALVEIATPLPFPLPPVVTDATPLGEEYGKGKLKLKGSKVMVFMLLKVEGASCGDSFEESDFFGCLRFEGM
jgi:hypothetical protein